jgi:hypothetical protein
MMMHANASQKQMRPMVWLEGVAALAAPMELSEEAAETAVAP